MDAEDNSHIDAVCKEFLNENLPLPYYTLLKHPSMVKQREGTCMSCMLVLCYKADLLKSFFPFLAIALAAT